MPRETAREAWAILGDRLRERFQAGEYWVKVPVRYASTDPRPEMDERGTVPTEVHLFTCEPGWRDGKQVYRVLCEGEVIEEISPS